jgi:HEPN domain-containing protein
MTGTSGWLVAADADLDAIRRCLIDPPNTIAAAYHCQQAAEKLIKALLVVLDIPYPRGRQGHDLATTASLIPATHRLRSAAEAFDAITIWSIAFRYPIDDPMQAEPLPDAAEVAAWFVRIASFRDEVAVLLETPGR